MRTSWFRTFKTLTSQRNPTPTLFRAGIVGLISVFFISCKFGNSQKVTLEGYDLISGYYTTAFSDLKLTAVFDSSPTPSVQALDESWLKPNWALIMTNPTLLFFDDPSRNEGTVRAALDTTMGFGVKIDPNLKTLLLGGSQQLFYRDCTWNYSVSGKGSFRDVSSSPVIGDFKTRGSLNLNLTEKHTWSGNSADCTEWLGNYRDCLLQLSPSCTADDTAFALSLFGIAFDSGMIDANTLPHLRSLETVATF